LHRKVAGGTSRPGLSARGRGGIRSFLVSTGADLHSSNHRALGTASAQLESMILMHSRPKEQREAVRHLVHSVLTRDMGTFNPERFKDWIKEVDGRFRKVGLMLLFEIRSRSVHFTIKEIRSGRTAFKFTASTHVPFDDREVVMSVEEFATKGTH
jgi:hypothetical protein